MRLALDTSNCSVAFSSVVPSSSVSASVLIAPVEYLPSSVSGTPILAIATDALLQFGAAASADDIIVEPWSATELRFRVLRLASAREWRFGTHRLTLQRDTLLASSGAGTRPSASLSASERTLLVALLRADESGVRRATLAQVLAINPDGRALDMQISRLRKKLHGLTRHWNAPLAILTERSRGYRLSQ